jgi:hypothetical protein
LNIFLWDRSLIAHVLLVEVRIILGEGDLEHSHNSLELKFVETFIEGLEFINDCDVADFVHLMKAFNTMFNQLSQVDCRLNSVGDTLDDNSIVLVSLIVE